jgi:Kef-type K+ transport system membrane component KefB
VTEPLLLRSLGLILVTAAAVALALARLRIPAIVAYIVAGLLLGPITGVLSLSDGIDLLARSGIVLLLFLVGLELSLEKLRDVGMAALGIGAAQVVAVAAAGFGAARLLGLPATGALFVGIALTFSSTVVGVKLLEQKQELHSAHGRLTIGILLVQDLAAMLVLTFLAGLTGSLSLSAAAVASGLGSAFLGMTLLLAVALVAARYLLPRVFAWAASSPEVVFIWALCWCFVLVLLAERLALSPEVGAFLAGIALAQLPYSHVLTRRVRPLMNFFLAVFFVSLGIEVEFAAAPAQLAAAAVLITLALVGKPLLVAWLAGRAGFGRRTAALTGISLAQISEFSFLSTALGVELGLVDRSVLSLVALVGLVTMGASAVLILQSGAVAAALERWGVLDFVPRREASEAVPAAFAPEIHGHVIVIGMNSLGRMIVQGLLARGERVLALDSDARKLAALPCETLLGTADDPAVLHEARFTEAKLVVSALQIEESNNLLAYRCRMAGVPASIHAFDRALVEELHQIGVNHLMISKNDGIKRLAAELHRAGLL